MQATLYESVISLSMLLAAIPSLAVLAAGQWYISKKDYPDRIHHWVLVWMVCANLLALPFALFSANFFTGAPGLVLLLVLPAFIGLQSLLLIHWRDVYSAWLEAKTLITILVGALILFLASTALGNPRLTALLVVPTLVLAAIWMIGARLGMGGLGITAVLLSALLLMDAVGILANHYVFSLTWLRDAYVFISGLGSLLAVIVAALCVKRYADTDQTGEQTSAWLYLILASILLLGVGAVTLRHGVLVVATSRAAEDHLPFAALAAGVIAGLLIALSTTGRGRTAGIAFMILVPVVVALSYTIGLQTDPQGVTAARAARIGTAVQRYYQDTGAYPASLGELTPAYLANLYGPLTGRGQAWCYQSGEGYYRLGYVFFQRYFDYPDDTPFWEPYYEIVVPYSAGQPPPGEWMCDEELRLYKSHGGL